MRGLRLLFKIGTVLIIGGIGGVLFERTLVPYLAQREPFSKIPAWTIERVTILEPKEEIIIDEAQALERAVGVVQPQIVAIERQDKKGAPLAGASGVILTADGVVVVSADVVGKVGTYSMFRERDEFVAKFVYEDKESGLALFKVDIGGWPVASFASSSDAVLGKRIFMLSQEHKEDIVDLLTTLTQGIVSQVAGDGTIDVDLDVKNAPAGSAIFTLEGLMLGMVQDGAVVEVATIKALFENTDLTGNNLAAWLFK